MHVEPFHLTTIPMPTDKPSRPLHMSAADVMIEPKEPLPAPLPVAVSSTTTAEGGIVEEMPLPLDPTLTLGTLPNGLTYYIKANARPKARAELRLVVKVGSMMEEEHERGLAHFLEHVGASCCCCRGF
jgi:zinc protease